MTSSRRVVLILVLGLGGLIPFQTLSNAQGVGSELMEPVSAEASGDEAYLVLQSVADFAPDGGDAVLEPGSPYEERFTYRAVETETNRLVGLTRPAPLAHSSGVFVGVEEPESAETTASPAPPTSSPAGSAEVTAEPDGKTADGAANPSTDESPESGEADQPAGAAQSAAAEPSDSSAVEALPVVCEDPDTLLCAALQQLVGQPCEDPDTVLCAVLQQLINEDPCDDSNTVLCAALAEINDLITGDPCDPDGIGQSCAEYVAGVLQDAPCAMETCQIRDDPLGPWSLCDLNGTDADCLDPEDVIDLVYEIDDPLLHLECVAGVSGPNLSEGGNMAKGRGWMDCGEVVALVEVKVCLHKNQGGVWIKMGCRSGESYGDGDGQISRKVVEPCAQKQTLKYRIRARGIGWDGTGPPGGNAEGDPDSAKATATFYCPGSASAGSLTVDLVDYAESWLPFDA